MLSFLALLDKIKMGYYNILSKIDNNKNIGCLTNEERINKFYRLFDILVCTIKGCQCNQTKNRFTEQQKEENNSLYESWKKIVDVKFEPIKRPNIPKQNEKKEMFNQKKMMMLKRLKT